MRIRNSIALGPLFVFLSLAASGQPPESPEFEAADIRVNPSGDPPAAQYLPGGQMTLHSMMMKLLVGLAWKETRILPEFTALSVALHPAATRFAFRTLAATTSIIATATI